MGSISFIFAEGVNLYLLVSSFDTCIFFSYKQVLTKLYINLFDVKIYHHGLICLSYNIHKILNRFIMPT